METERKENKLEIWWDYLVEMAIEEDLQIFVFANNRTGEVYSISPEGATKKYSDVELDHTLILSYENWDNDQVKK